MQLNRKTKYKYKKHNRIYISRIYMLEIHHSGWEPSIYDTD